MQWSPRPASTSALTALGVGLVLVLVGALVLGVPAIDAPGRVLLAAAAVLVLCLAGRDVVARPRLTAGPDGVVVRTGFTRRHLPWSGLRVRVREVRRFGLRGRTLELESELADDEEGTLVVLGRWDLGVAPEHVATALAALRPDRSAT